MISRPWSAAIRVAAASFMLLTVVVWSGCGNDFRPVATPEFPPGGDPESRREAVVIYDSTTPTTTGITQHINVSGDTIVDRRTIGRGAENAAAPVRVADFTQNNFRFYVVNERDDSITSYPTFSTAIAPVTTSLGLGADPVYLQARGPNRIFVAMTGDQVNDDPCGTTGSVGLILTDSNILTETICPGNRPVSVMESPDFERLFILNQDDEDVSIRDGVSPFPEIAADVPVGTLPVAMEMTSDGSHLFVLNRGSNNVTVIDVEEEEDGDPVYVEHPDSPVPVGATPIKMVYDPRLERIYVINQGSATISVINADPDSAGFLNVLPTATLSGGASPLAIVALPDGTKFYVTGDENCAGNTDGNNADTNDLFGQVSVFSTTNNAFLRCLDVTENPISIDASPDSSKVYVASSNEMTPQHPGGVAIIRTTNDNIVQPSNTPTGVTIPSVLVAPNSAACDDPAEEINCEKYSPVAVISTD